MNAMTDPALIAANRVRMADQALDFISARHAVEHMREKVWVEIDAAEMDYASAIPSTSDGMAAKLAVVRSSLACVRDGDELTPEGAQQAIQHLDSLLAAVGG